MGSNSVNALATSIIAFVTVIVAMFGFYYNLRTSGIALWNILGFEVLFLIALLFFILEVKEIVG